MKQRIEVTTQAEFDACIQAGNIAVCVSGRFVARENASVEARENASVEAWGNASVVAWGNASVEAWENASVEAWGNASVEARENASVVAWGNASVEAWENAFIRLFSALKITATLYVTILLHGKAKSITGGRKLKANKPKTAKAWCEHYGVRVKAHVAILYKALNDDYSSSYGFFYKPGSVPVAPDWDGGKKECGGGLHFSPYPKMALEFHPSATRFMACPVKLSDIVVHPDGEYPQKVKAKCCCGPVYEVDRNGKRV